jgi:hypothetical protein
MTLGSYVYLGKGVKKSTRTNAITAGLIPMNKRLLVQLWENNQAIQRILAEGTWSDTVKYDATIYRKRKKPG